MDGIIDALKSGNVVAWAIIVVLTVLALKLLQSAGKGLVILLLAIGVAVAVYRFFPGVVEPMVDFVRGGWLGDQR